jgi:hypothetical protein
MDVLLVLDDITPLYEIKDKPKADKLLNVVLLIECKDKAID